MSFNSTFDFTKVITYIDSRIANEESCTDMHNTELTTLNSVQGYADLTQSRTSLLARMCQHSLQRKTELLSAKTLINTLTSLSVDQKNNLYSIWLIALANSNSKDVFMAKMVSGHAEMLTKLANVVNNADLNLDTKKMLVKIGLNSIQPSNISHRYITWYA